MNKPNYTYSIVGVALVLFLLGVCGLFVLHAGKLVKIFKEKVNVMVELKDDADQEAIAGVIAAIESEDYAKEESVDFISKEVALEELEADFGEEIISLDFQNPLYNMITFNIKAEYLNSDDLEGIQSELRLNENVKDVYYQEGLVDNISSNIKSIGYMALFISLLFIIVAITLIHNTIKLAMYSNRFIIKNMELVGASWEFISRPYLLRGIKNGFLSAMLAIIILLLLLFLAQQDLPELKQLQDNASLGILMGGLLLLGVLISGLSTYYVVNKFLKMKLDELY